MKRTKRQSKKYGILLNTIKALEIVQKAGGIEKDKQY